MNSLASVDLKALPPQDPGLNHVSSGDSADSVPAVGKPLRSPSSEKEIGSKGSRRPSLQRGLMVKRQSSQHDKEHEEGVHKAATVKAPLPACEEDDDEDMPSPLASSRARERGRWRSE